MWFLFLDPAASLAVTVTPLSENHCKDWACCTFYVSVFLWLLLQILDMMGSKTVGSYTWMPCFWRYGIWYLRRSESHKTFKSYFRSPSFTSHKAQPKYSIFKQLHLSHAHKLYIAYNVFGFKLWRTYHLLWEFFSMIIYVKMHVFISWIYIALIPSKELLLLFLED